MRQARAVVSYTLRSCLPLGRRIGLMVLAAVALMFGLLARVPEGPPPEAFGRVATVGLFGLVLPLAALLVGDAVLGAEVRGGTFVFTWLSPVPVATLVVGRWIGGALLTVLTMAPAFALAAVLGEQARSAGPIAIAAAVGSSAYVAVFVAVGALTRRSTVVALVLVFLVERLLGGVLAAVAQLSPSWEAAAVFTGLTQAPQALVRKGIPAGWSAVGRLALISAVALIVARWSLARIRLTGASD